MNRNNATLYSRRSFLAGLGSLAISSPAGIGAQRNQVVAPSSPPNPDPYAGKKKVLAIGDVHTGYQHDSVSHALAKIERLGRDSGLFVT
ncbi:MAG: Trehalose utilization [Edaphobacter sp.]|nr:Trehalose utilization [Edaphobacter sp.]